MYLPIYVSRERDRWCYRPLLFTTMQDNYIVYFAQAVSWHTAEISLREFELHKALMKRMSEDEQAENESKPAGQVGIHNGREM